MTTGECTEMMKRGLDEEPLDAPGPMLGKRRLVAGFESVVYSDRTLQQALDEVVNNILANMETNEKKKYAFAVVDLSYDPTSPINDPRDKSNYDKSKNINHPQRAAYAGWNDNTNLEIASMAKLLPLYAAFQLRSDLRCVYKKLKKQNSSPQMTELKAEAERLYKPISIIRDVSKIFTIDSDTVDFKKIKENDTVNDGVPRVLEDFDYKENGKFANFEEKDFVTDAPLESPYLSDAYLSLIHGLGEEGPTKNEQKHKEKISKIKFHEHLRLMAGWSDNYAASLVVDALGYEYMWNLSLRSGLYQPSIPRGGLFLASNYYDRGKRWGNWPSLVGEGAYVRQGNAKCIAILMTMMGMESLIDHETHIEMNEMLRRWPGRARSFIAEGMRASGWDYQNPAVSMNRFWQYGNNIPPLNQNDFNNPDSLPPVAASKIGIGAANPPTKTNIEYCDALLIRLKRSNMKTQTAVLVAIDMVSSNPLKIRDFGMQMARKLDARHP